MRQVEDPLVVGVGVDRVHEAALDPERLVDDLRDRGEAVRRAGGVRDEAVLGPKRLVVDAEDDHGVEVVLRGGGEEHLLRAGR